MHAQHRTHTHTDCSVLRCQSHQIPARCRLKFTPSSSSPSSSPSRWPLPETRVCVSTCTRPGPGNPRTQTQCDSITQAERLNLTQGRTKTKITEEERKYAAERWKRSRRRSIRRKRKKGSFGPVLCKRVFIFPLPPTVSPPTQVRSNNCCQDSIFATQTSRRRQGILPSSSSFS